MSEDDGSPYGGMNPYIAQFFRTGWYRAIKLKMAVDSWEEVDADV